MKINTDFWLANTVCRASPHFDERPNNEQPSLLVLHGISLPAGSFGGNEIDDLFMGQLDCNPQSQFAPLEGLRVSAHCLIRRNGQIIQYVPFNKRAWHAGISSFQGRSRCNDFSIGIELEGTDSALYCYEQYFVLEQLTKALIALYPQITLGRIVGHNDIAPNRKTDPGFSFNWALFRASLMEKKL